MELLLEIRLQPGARYCVIRMEDYVQVAPSTPQSLPPICMYPPVSTSNTAVRCPKFT